MTLAASGSPAGAVTIGQLAPSPENNCMGLVVADFVQPSVNSGQSYVVPATNGIASWTLTSWSTNATAAPGQKMSLKIFRRVSDAPAYLAVSHEGPHDLQAGLNRFSVRLLAQPGDLLGSHFNGPMGACTFDAPGEKFDTRSGDLQDGEVDDFTTNSMLQWRVNISAEITPTSDFTLGMIARNKKKGTATLTLNVPNPGELTGSGKGVKVASAAVTSRTVTAPGQVNLTIRAKGKKKRKLNETGKVKVNPTIAYTPTGGVASTQSTKLKLKKRR